MSIGVPGWLQKTWWGDKVFSMMTQEKLAVTAVLVVAAVAAAMWTLRDTIAAAPKPRLPKRIAAWQRRMQYQGRHWARMQAVPA